MLTRNGHSMEYLQSLKQAPVLSEDIKTFITRIEEQYDKRLWHQLTTTVQEFLQLSGSEPIQVAFFDGFLSGIASNLDQLKYAQIASRVAQHHQGPAEALAFLLSIADSVRNSGSDEAFILATMEAAHYRLLLGDMDEIQSAIARCRALLDAQDNVKATVHASFYKTSGDFHKAKAEYSEYYATSLQYLACIDIDSELNQQQKVQRAHDVALAALLGQTTYNFGELLMHPILDSLKSTEFDWIRSLLFAFNEGSIGKFEACLPSFQSETILQENYAFLRQKICLMALIEAIFRRPAGSRVISFGQIASETSLPTNEVEHLLMKAMSLGLIAGAIDQVQQAATVHWVQARVLETRQIARLGVQLAGWSENVQRTGDFAQSRAPELFVAT